MVSDDQQEARHGPDLPLRRHLQPLPEVSLSLGLGEDEGGDCPLAVIPHTGLLAV